MSRRRCVRLGRHRRAMPWPQANRWPSLLPLANRPTTARSQPSRVVRWTSTWLANSTNCSSERARRSGGSFCSTFILSRQFRGDVRASSMTPRSGAGSRRPCWPASGKILRANCHARSSYRASRRAGLRAMNSASRSSSPPRHLACPAISSTAFCCSSIRQLVIRSSASTPWQRFTTRCTFRRRSISSRSGRHLRLARARVPRRRTGRCRLTTDCAPSLPLWLGEFPYPRATSNGATRPRPAPASSRDDVEEVSPRAILDFNNPNVRVEFELARQIGVDRRIGRRLLVETSTECACGGWSRIKCALRRRPKQVRCTVEPADAHEHGARLFGAAPAQHGKYALNLTTAYIGGNPKCGFEAHVQLTASGSEV